MFWCEFNNVIPAIYIQKFHHYWFKHLGSFMWRAFKYSITLSLFLIPTISWILYHGGIDPTIFNFIVISYLYYFSIFFLITGTKIRSSSPGFTSAIHVYHYGTYHAELHRATLQLHYRAPAATTNHYFTTDLEKRLKLPVCSFEVNIFRNSRRFICNTELTTLFLRE